MITHKLNSHFFGKAGLDLWKKIKKPAKGGKGEDSMIERKH